VFVSSNIDQLGRNRPACHVQKQHRVGWRAPPLGGTARVEDPELAVPRDLWLVRVAVDDGVAALEPTGQPLCTTLRFAGVVRDPDPRFLHLDDAATRKELLQLGIVHVPVDGLERAEGGELFENPSLHEVPRMQDQVRALEIGEALRRDPTRSARKMRVRDDRDERQAPGVVFFFFEPVFRLGSPTLNAPPTWVMVRAGFVSAASRIAKA
jgi:hypothetical protein